MFVCNFKFSFNGKRTLLILVLNLFFFLSFQPDSMKQYIKKLEEARIEDYQINELFTNQVCIKPPKVISEKFKY